MTIVAVKEFEDGFVQLCQSRRGEDIYVAIDAIKILAVAIQQIDMQTNIALFLTLSLAALIFGSTRTQTQFPPLGMANPLPDGWQLMEEG